MDAAQIAARHWQRHRCGEEDWELVREIDALWRAATRAALLKAAKIAHHCASIEGDDCDCEDMIRKLLSTVPE